MKYKSVIAVLISCIALVLSASCEEQGLGYSTDRKDVSGQTQAPADTPAANEPLELTYNVENGVTSTFISTVSYPDDDYSYTKIEAYCDLKTSYEKDRPSPAKISWDLADGTISQTLYVSSDASFSSPAETKLNAYDTATQIWNLTPGKVYYAKVCAAMADGSYTVPQSWVITPTGRVRMLYIDGVFNVRDLGGWTAENGKTIKYGKLIRGGAMNVKGNISEYGKRQLLSEGVGAVCDLRMDSESQSITSSLLGSDIDFWRISDQVWAYVNAMAGKGDTHLQALQWIINELKAGKEVYFHCSRGADRTGTMAFVIECLLGVSESDLAKDYELTSFSTTAGERFRPGASDHNYSGMISELKKYPGETLQDKMTSYLLQGIAGTSISQSDIDWLKANLLE